jgi:hypothetical protein
MSTMLQRPLLLGWKKPPINIGIPVNTKLKGAFLRKALHRHTSSINSFFPLDWSILGLAFITLLFFLPLPMS